MSILAEIERIQQTKADLKTAIINKGVDVSDTDTLDTFASKVESISDSGIPANMEWANHTTKVMIKDDSWAEEETVMYVPNLTSLAESFKELIFRKVKVLTVKSDVPIENTNFAFLGVNSSDYGTLETVIFDCDFSQCKYFSQTFQFRRSLKSIEGNPIDFSSATAISNTFNYATNIENFRVVAKTIKVNMSLSFCSKLNDETIQSIVDGLADLSNSDALALTLNASTIAKLTETQLQQIADKNWNVA